MKTLQEVIAERDEAVVQTKLAAVEEAFQGNEQAVTLFSQALDFLKEAGVTDSGTAIDLAMQAVIDTLGEESETAATEPEAEAEKIASAEDLQAAEEAGAEAANLAFAAGVTVEDYEKIASADEAEAFGALLGAAYLKVAAESEQE